MKQRYPGWDNREYEDRMTYMRTILEPIIKLEAAAQEVVDQRGKHHAFPHKALEKLRWQLRAADARREEVGAAATRSNAGSVTELRACPVLPGSRCAGTGVSRGR